MANGYKVAAAIGLDMVGMAVYRQIGTADFNVEFKFLRSSSKSLRLIVFQLNPRDYHTGL